MVMNERPLKRRRRVTADFYNFYTFPAAGDAISGAPFRKVLPCFLSRYARPAFPMASLFPSLMTWQILLRVGDSVAGEEDGCGVTLYVVEEDVTGSSRSVYCDQCRVVGWGGHPVCRKRYHFIIPAEKNNATGNQVLQQLEVGDGTPKACTVCGNMLHLLDSRCETCNFATAEDNNEDWLYSQLEDSTHLLHGVVHSNGYGHLITLNGREGGSKIISGCDILNFWDRLCQTLAVRKISVMDVSKKYGLEYRLLHAITYGHSWYGNWGYEFGTGSYGTQLNAYQNAVTSLSTIPLSLFTSHGRGPATHLQELIRFYQWISDSKLVTLQDLFSFVLLLIQKRRGGSCKTGESEKPKCSGGSCKTGESEKPKCSFIKPSCQWSIDDVKRVEEAMIKVLLATTGSDAGWVSRCALKGAQSRTGSPELLDYCLKHLGGKVASNGLVVNSRYNNSSTIELRLEPSGSVMIVDQPSKEQVIHDLKYMYDSIVYPQATSYRSQATREIIINSATRVLDCKHFVKDYKPDKPETSSPFAIYLWCHVELKDRSKDDPTPPPELLILPENVSVADLKIEATKAFQEVYVMFKRFEAEEMLEYGPLDDSLTLKLLVGSRGSVKVCGRCLGTHGLGRFRMERGTENWTVDCVCGAKDDDGEKMLACDECETWQHTRCAGIDDQDEIPAKFVCTRCLDSDMEQESNQDDQFSGDVDKIMPSKKSKTCRASVVKSKGRRNMSVFNPTFGVH